MLYLRIHTLRLLQVTPKEFIESPTQEAMAGLSRSEWLEFAKGELSAIPDVSEMADRALYLCMRMSSPLNTVHRADTKQKICSLCGGFQCCSHTS